MEGRANVPTRTHLIALRPRVNVLSNVLCIVYCGALLFCLVVDNDESGCCVFFHHGRRSGKRRVGVSRFQVNCSDLAVLHQWPTAVVSIRVSLYVRRIYWTLFAHNNSLSQRSCNKITIIKFIIIIMSIIYYLSFFIPVNSQEVIFKYAKMILFLSRPHSSLSKNSVKVTGEKIEKKAFFLFMSIIFVLLLCLFSLYLLVYEYFFNDIITPVTYLTLTTFFTVYCFNYFKIIYSYNGTALLVK